MDDKTLLGRGEAFTLHWYKMGEDHDRYVIMQPLPDDSTGHARTDITVQSNPLSPARLQMAGETLEALYYVMKIAPYEVSVSYTTDNSGRKRWHVHGAEYAMGQDVEANGPTFPEAVAALLGAKGKASP